MYVPTSCVLICTYIALYAHSPEGVTVTVVGILDDPPIILTITSKNPDNSEPTNCLDANSISSAIIKQILHYLILRTCKLQPKYNSENC